MAIAASIDTVLRARVDKFQADMGKAAGVVKSFAATARKASNSVSSFFGSASPKAMIGSYLTLEAIKKTIAGIQSGLERGLFAEKDAAVLRGIGAEVTKVQDAFTKFVGEAVVKFAPMLQDIFALTQKVISAFATEGNIAADAISFIADSWRAVQAALSNVILLSIAAFEALTGNMQVAKDIANDVFSGEATRQFYEGIQSASVAMESTATATKATADEMARVHGIARDIQSQADQIRESLMSPQELLDRDLRRIFSLYEANAISLDEFKRATEQARQAFTKSQPKMNFGLGDGIRSAAAAAGDFIASAAASLGGISESMAERAVAMTESPMAIEFGTQEFASALIQAQRSDDSARREQQMIAILGEVKTAINGLIKGAASLVKASI